MKSVSWYATKPEELLDPTQFLNELRNTGKTSMDTGQQETTNCINNERTILTHAFLAYNRGSCYKSVGATQDQCPYVWNQFDNNYKDMTWNVAGEEKCNTGLGGKKNVPMGAYTVYIALKYGNNCSSSTSTNFNGTWNGDWLEGNKIVKKPATNSKINGANTMKPEMIVLHNTGNVNDQLDSIWNYFNGGAHEGAWTQFIVGQDGTIYQMAEANKRAVHCSGYNTNSVGIEGCGLFDSKNPSEEQYNAYLNLVKAIMNKYNIPANNVYGHMELNTSRQWGCPGWYFLNKLRKDIGLTEISPRTGTSLEPIDSHGGNALPVIK